MKRETTLDHRPNVSEYCNFIFVIMIYYYITIKEKSIIDNIHLLGLYGLGNIIIFDKPSYSSNNSWFEGYMQINTLKQSNEFL